MRLSIATWLRLEDQTHLHLDLTVYNLDLRTNEPILRLTQIIPIVPVTTLDQNTTIVKIVGYILAVFASVCAGIPSHLLLHHFSDQEQTIPIELSHHLIPRQPIIRVQTQEPPQYHSHHFVSIEELTHSTSSEEQDQYYNSSDLDSSDESLYPLSPISLELLSTVSSPPTTPLE